MNADRIVSSADPGVVLAKWNFKSGDRGGVASFVAIENVGGLS